MKVHEDLSYVQSMRLDKEWSMSSSLVSHNCHGEKEVNTNWGHTSRYNTPLACYGCGEIAPEKLEKIFRDLLALGGRTPDKIVAPFSSYDGAPGAKERYEELRGS